MSNFNVFRTQSYQKNDNSQNEEIIIHNNQTNIYDFLQPKQLTIFDFLKAQK